jgi:hypothetical protein
MPSSSPRDQYTLSEEAKELLRSLLFNHKEYLEREGEASDEVELELTESLIELFEDS